MVVVVVATMMLSFSTNWLMYIYSYLAQLLAGRQLLERMPGEATGTREQNHLRATHPEFVSYKRELTPTTHTHTNKGELSWI